MVGLLAGFLVGVVALQVLPCFVWLALSRESAKLLNFGHLGAMGGSGSPEAVSGSFAGCVHSCCDVDEIDLALRLVQWGREFLDGKIYVAFGIHPTNFEEFTDEVEDRLLHALEQCGRQGVAWGECGLDYCRRAKDIEDDPSVRDRMKEAFARRSPHARSGLGHSAGGALRSDCLPLHVG